MPTKDTDLNDVTCFIEGKPVSYGRNLFDGAEIVYDTIPGYIGTYTGYRVIAICGLRSLNKRVFHLMRHAKSHRVREKNWQRILKLSTIRKE